MATADSFSCIEFETRSSQVITVLLLNIHRYWSNFIFSLSWNNCSLERHLSIAKVFILHNILYITYCYQMTSTPPNCLNNILIQRKLSCTDYALANKYVIRSTHIASLQCWKHALIFQVYTSTFISYLICHIYTCIWKYYWFYFFLQ